MKKLTLLFTLLFASLGFGQTLMVTTTLSAANTNSSAQKLVVTSATGINAPSTTDNTKATFLYVDRELLYVTAVSGTTVTVVRGQEGTVGTTHASGAVVFVIPAYLSTSQGGPVGSPGGAGGSCTRTNELLLPRLNYSTGIISDCLGGQWVSGDASQTTRYSGKILYAPNPGGTIYTSLNSTGTTLAATTMYCTEIQLPYSRYMTGLAPLLGTVGGTDKHLVVLYDSSGNLLANSAVAGATAGTASTYEQIAFTVPFYAVGPADYFACMQTNGTTATVRMLVTSVEDGFLTKGITGQTFGTIPATITVPTTFTTAVGPYWQLY